MTRGRLILLMSLLAAFWGMSFFGSNVALKYMNTFQILSVRWTISMFIFIFLIVTGKVKLRIRRKFAVAACDGDTSTLPLFHL